MTKNISRIAVDAEEKPRILIVDDIKPEIDFLVKFLQDQYQCDFALDGETALDRVAAHPPDLILLDIIMPGLDGYEVCRRLKDNSRTRNIPIIFITSLSDEEEAGGLELGAVDYVTKPFRIPVIKARVRNHIELKRRGDLLERLASIDSLTGIANRRRLKRIFDIEWRRNMRAGTPLSMIMIDIDNFKQYNDGYGHMAGDDCLKRVARHLAGVLNRASDFVARFGGEEFVALLPATDSPGAATVAEHMRERIASLGIVHAASPVANHVTISLGIATIVPQKGMASMVLLEAADKAMYKAKQAGRNRVEYVDIRDRLCSQPKMKKQISNDN